MQNVHLFILDEAHLIGGESGVRDHLRLCLLVGLFWVG